MKILTHSIARFFLLSLLMGSLSAVADSSTVYSSVSAGNYHTCALTNAGTVNCWGSNTYGQLGNGWSSSEKIYNMPMPVSSLSGVTAISAGYDHSCALTNTGTVKCWGSNAQGQLGDGTNDNANTPVAVAGLSGVAAISAGRIHTCALLNTGTVKCWGYNFYGQLGTGTYSQYGKGVNTPVDVSGLSDVTAISTGANHTCALTITGTVKCWGANPLGQLGDAVMDFNPPPRTGDEALGPDHFDWTKSSIPVDVTGLNGVTAISTGTYHTCALMTAGTVKCLGGNEVGQLGNGESGEDNHTSTPVDVIDLSGVIAISGNSRHTCALTNTGAVKCWGNNYWGELGNGTKTLSNIPVGVSDLSGVAAISTGGIHTCALLNAGDLKCWGANFAGQLGNLTNTDAKTSVDVFDKNLSAKTFYSWKSRDGWVLESSENSSKGGWLNSSSRLRLGDSASDRQYRSLVHFDTSTLPDAAVIVKAQLRLYRSSYVGSTYNLDSLLASVHTGYYGNSSSLVLSDFESPSSVSSVVTLKNPFFSLYSGSMISSGLSSISKTASTQFRLRFSKGDNDDQSADYLNFYSGESDIENRPKLEVWYYVP